MKKLKISFNAPVVLGFTGLSLIVTILGVLSGGSVTKLLFMTYRDSLANPLTYLRMFTHVLGHSGFEHYMGNAMYLLLIGPMLEEKYGGKTMIRVILITAVVTSLINFLLFPGVGLCGASGVVFAWILMTSFTGFKNGEIPITFILVAVIFIGQQVVEGVFVQDNISNTAHIVGGIVGAFVGYRFNRKA